MGDRRLRDAGLLALVGYAALLALAAWPEEVRPGALDLPSRLANFALRKVGIVAGVPVYEPPRQRIVRLELNDCIRVRGFDRQGRAEVLAPPGGACFTSGVRFTIPWPELALRSLLLRSTKPTNQAAIGDYFCHGRRFRERRFAEIEVFWWVPWRDLRSGETGRTPVFVYRWQCRPAHILWERTGPSEDELRRLGVEPAG